MGETPQWFKVNINGNIGYVNKAFLVNTPTQTEQTEETQATASSSTIISAEQTRGLLSELNASPKSVEGFEQEQIQRLLNEGASVEQITNILKISRSTLYRRIKKYNFKSKE